MVDKLAGQSIKVAKELEGLSTLSRTDGEGSAVALVQLKAKLAKYSSIFYGTYQALNMAAEQIEEMELKHPQSKEIVAQVFKVLFRDKIDISRVSFDGFMAFLQREVTGPPPGHCVAH